MTGYQGQFKKEAKRWWPRAISIVGVGPWACVAYCGGTSVTLHEKQNEATDALKMIAQTGCGGRCRRNHLVVNITPPGGWDWEKKE